MRNTSSGADHLAAVRANELETAADQTTSRGRLLSRSQRREPSSRRAPQIASHLLRVDWLCGFRLWLSRLQIRQTKRGRSESKKYKEKWIYQLKSRGVHCPACPTNGCNLEASSPYASHMQYHFHATHASPHSNTPFFLRSKESLSDGRRYQ